MSGIFRNIAFFRKNESLEKHLNRKAKLSYLRYEISVFFLNFEKEDETN